MSTRALYLLLFFVATTSGLVMANPTEGLKKVGQAKLELLFWDIYTSELFSANGQYQVDTFPIALKIKYLRNIDAQDLISKTQEEWLKLGVSAEQASPWLVQLKELWPNIKKNDELLLVVSQELGNEFFFNGHSLGQVNDNDFGPSFLRIWLDPNCTYPKLRKKLIGEKN